MNTPLLPQEDTRQRERVTIDPPRASTPIFCDLNKSWRFGRVLALRPLLLLKQRRRWQQQQQQQLIFLSCRLQIVQIHVCTVGDGGGPDLRRGPKYGCSGEKVGMKVVKKLVVTSSVQFLERTRRPLSRREANLRRRILD